jgi:hypothetical protein
LAPGQRTAFAERDPEGTVPVDAVDGGHRRPPAQAASLSASPGREAG